MHTENSPEKPALEVQGLQIGYPGANPPLSLCGTLEFDLPEGVLTAVIGVNGVGKSTLLRTLGGLQPAISGRIRIGGQPASGIPAASRARLQSIVLTEPPASRNLTVAELVALGRHPYTNWLGKLSPEDSRITGEAIRRMELEALRDRPCHTLSDGQLQRVLIARALAQDTPLILLDEPTTHLDLYHKVRILKGLRSIAHETRKTILFTTHEIDLAIQLCDRMLILQQAESVFGEPCELIRVGAFEELFPEDTVIFDPDSGVFRINK
nr:ABC transporter ATP-binding protein [Robiginitalea sp. SC105]